MEITRSRKCDGRLLTSRNIRQSGHLLVHSSSSSSLPPRRRRPRSRQPDLLDPRPPDDPDASVTAVMPFERYLQQPPHPDPAHATDPPPSVYTHDPATFSANVQFQLPNLVLGPSVAPGGGAEVLPAGFLGNAAAFHSSWFANHSFPRTSDLHKYACSCFLHRTFVSSYF